MFCRFSIAAGLTAHVMISGVIPPPITKYQIAFSLLIIVFSGFISAGIAYLTAERVFREFINDLNRSVWKISRKLITSKKIIKISIKKRMIILLIPLLIFTFSIIAFFIYIQMNLLVNLGSIQECHLCLKR